ncbi:MAG: hypothetical protein ACFE8P_04995, partial [Promethearchaeota archaeon]
IDIAEKYRNTFEQMKGNALRWKNQIDLISKFVEKRLLDLKVALSDTKQRYNSQIKKTSSLIDNSKVESKLVDKGDEIENWRVEEKKKVIESISTLFLTVERNTEDMLKRNKFFTRADILKSKIYEDLQPKFSNHFIFLKEQGEKFNKTIDALFRKYEDIVKRAGYIDEVASQKLKAHKEELKNQLHNRNLQITNIEIEQENAINKILSYKKELEELYKQITDIIDKKNKTCLKESEELKVWSLHDNKLEFFAMPIRWMYMPLYAVFVEDEDLMEERMDVVLPGCVIDSNSLYEDFSDTMVNLKSILLEKVEEDMIVRSNFEFCCENKNLVKEPNLDKKLMKGIASLRYLDLLTTDSEKKIRDSFGFLP